MDHRRYAPLQHTHAGGGSQTPWTSDIDGAGYQLSNVSVELGDTNTTVIESTDSDGWLAFRPANKGWGAYFHDTGDVGVYASADLSSPPVAADSGYAYFTLWDPATDFNIGYWGYGSFAEFEVQSGVHGADLNVNGQNAAGALRYWLYSDIANDRLRTQSNFDPYTDSTYDLGSTSNRWSTVHADAATILGSVTAADFNGVALTDGGAATNYLDESGNYSVPAASYSGPTENVILTGTKTSGQNINGVENTETDLTWDVVSQDATELTSFSSGNSDVVFTNAGWINVHASSVIVDGLMNNRTIILCSMYHYNTSDVLQYSYHGGMHYNRDDANTYDGSGAFISQNMMYVAAGDYIVVRTRIVDDGTSGTTQTLDTTYSKIRVARIEF